MLLPATACPLVSPLGLPLPGPCSGAQCALGHVGIPFSKVPTEQFKGRYGRSRIQVKNWFLGDRLRPRGPRAVGLMSESERLPVFKHKCVFPLNSGTKSQVSQAWKMPPVCLSRTGIYICLYLYIYIYTNHLDCCPA